MPCTVAFKQCFLIYRCGGSVGIDFPEIKISPTSRLTVFQDGKTAPSMKRGPIYRFLKILSIHISGQEFLMPAGAMNRVT
jgi:hypothetical protein